MNTFIICAFFRPPASFRWIIPLLPFMNSKSVSGARGGAVPYGLITWSINTNTSQETSSYHSPGRCSKICFVSMILLYMSTHSFLLSARRSSMERVSPRPSVTRRTVTRPLLPTEQQLSSMSRSVSSSERCCRVLAAQ
jgi:hypothetical protein